ncbi:MAG TPA: aspartate kinase, partial [Thermoanaerobaculia bacterium]
MLERPLAVLKFGSSVLQREDAIPVAVHEVYRHLRLGYRVVAVVSALGKTTDRLLSLARGLGDAPPSSVPLASLLATGEAASAALLAIALDRSGIPAALIEAARLRLRTWGHHLDAEPCELDRGELLRA